MSRIFPDSNYNIFEDLKNPRSKSEWGYGYESSNNPEYINYKQFIDKLDQHVDKDFKIWIGTDPYNPKSFTEICIFDQKNGNFHLIEYFPFKYRESVNFIFDIDKEIVSSDKTNIVDNNNNEYQFEKAKINLKSSEIAGKELTVNFMDSYFGNPENDPVLKGRGATSDENETKIFKVAFLKLIFNPAKASKL